MQDLQKTYFKVKRNDQKIGELLWLCDSKKTGVIKQYSFFKVGPCTYLTITFEPRLLKELKESKEQKEKDLYKYFNKQNLQQIHTTQAKQQCFPQYLWYKKQIEQFNWDELNDDQLGEAAILFSQNIGNKQMEEQTEKNQLKFLHEKMDFPHQKFFFKEQRTKKLVWIIMFSEKQTIKKIVKIVQECNTLEKMVPVTKQLCLYTSVQLSKKQEQQFQKQHNVDLSKHEEGNNIYNLFPKSPETISPIQKYFKLRRQQKHDIFFSSDLANNQEEDEYFTYLIAQKKDIQNGQVLKIVRQALLQNSILILSKPLVVQGLSSFMILIISCNHHYYEAISEKIKNRVKGESICWKIVKKSLSAYVGNDYKKYDAQFKHQYKCGLKDLNEDKILVTFQTCQQALQFYKKYTQKFRIDFEDDQQGMVKEEIDKRSTGSSD